MARRIFFSFHYGRDIFRVNVVRNSDVTKKDVEQSGYWDHSLWEEAKKKGDAELQRIIRDGLKNTSVTVVLTGAETYLRPWVRYELVKSFERGNGLMTVYIHNIETPKGGKDVQGADPLNQLYFTIAADKKTALIHQWLDGAWKSYMTIDATTLHPSAQKAGKGQLSVGAASYDWMSDDGYHNFAKWIERAAKDAGK